MWTPRWCREAIAVALCAGLALGASSAGAAEPAGRQDEGARRESPYARYAREHAKAAEVKRARVKPTSSLGRGSRPHPPRAARH